MTNTLNYGVLVTEHQPLMTSIPRHGQFRLILRRNVYERLSDELYAGSLAIDYI